MAIPSGGSDVVRRMRWWSGQAGTTGAPLFLELRKLLGHEVVQRGELLERSAPAGLVLLAEERCALPKQGGLLDVTGRVQVALEDVDVEVHRDVVDALTARARAAHQADALEQDDGLRDRAPACEERVGQPVDRLLGRLAHAE